MIFCICTLSKTNTSHLENAWLDYENLLLGREGIYICNNRRTLLGGSSQDLDTWLGSPPFIGATNFGHLE